MTGQTFSIESRRQAWHDQLIQISSQPLKHCQAFPEIARRWEGWWNGTSEQPLILSQLSTDADIRWDKAFDLLDRPDEWLRVRRRQVEETVHFGEALPSVRVDFGPVALAAYLGTPLHFAGEEQTTWQDTIIQSWDAPISIEVDWDNRWLKQTLEFLDILAQDAQGNYLVCLPDLTGAIDAIANMRGPADLCFDLFENREVIIATAKRVVDAWETIFTRAYDTILARGAGPIQWVTSWSDTSYTLPTCDFNALIGPIDFREICLPALADQARRAGRCVFHLDGPDAARHAKALGEDPDITAVQFTPGAGTPSALAQLAMFQMLQEHGKSLFLEVEAHEIRELATQLNPKLVAYRVSDLKTASEAEDLVAWRDATFS